MTTYVQVSEEDPALDLLQLLNIKVDKKITEEIQKENYLPVFEECFKRSKKIFNLNDEVIATVFALQFQMIQLLKSKNANDIVLKLTDILSEGAEPESPHCETKLDLLTHLFNMLADESPSRARVFIKLLEFARATNCAEMLAGRMQSLDRWVRVWKLSETECRQLFSMAAIINEDAGKIKEAQHFRQKYLERFDVDGAKPEEAHAVASTAACCAIRRTEGCDRLLEYAAVRHLATTDAPLYRLLKIFAGGSTRDLDAWSVEHGREAWDKFAIDEQEAKAKLRVLTICSLASQQKHLSYTLLKQELMVETDLEVEKEILNGVRSGLLEAKIDQVSQTVTILKTTEGPFTEQSWVQLKDKLNLWKENTRNILILLRHAGQQAHEARVRAH
eukprot:99797_1